MLNRKGFLLLECLVSLLILSSLVLLLADFASNYQRFSQVLASLTTDE